MASTMWDFFVSYILPIVSTLLGGALLWLSKLLKDKFGLQIEAAQRDALQTALTNAAGLILSKVGGKLDETNVGPNSPIVRSAVDYVLRSAPEALDYFGLSPTDIAEKIQAKMGLHS